MKNRMKRVSSSRLLIYLVMGIVTIALSVGFCVFLAVYRRNMIQNASISSEQAVAQVSGIVDSFTKDIYSGIQLAESIFGRESTGRDADMNALVAMRAEIELIASYDLESGSLTELWSGKHPKKEEFLANLSFEEEMLEVTKEQGKLYISKPHVESLLVNYYPWVVSVCKRMKAPDGKERLVVMDTRFTQIANYVRNVGIGHHGYCFIVDEGGNIIYHPQQQLIFSGLKQGEMEGLAAMPDGSFTNGDIIHTVKTRADNGWRIVGISYVTELVKDKVKGVVGILTMLVLFMLLVTFCSSVVISRMISRPIKRLMDAMGEFERDARAFCYQPIEGTSEIAALSDSFGHMVVQIQELMETVRNEEITLRKTELRALQAQINPHFLYNTLDSIAWMCEDDRKKDAVEMVNALARLFRISISKGHELIPIQKEVEHAESYLKIQNFRYKNQFTYQLSVQEECLPYYCNKITLQPIIENAIYHGLNRMIDEGIIRISIFEKDGTVTFIVEDNGVGMTPEQCSSILKKEQGDKNGIGIKNVNDRIQIYFGAEYGIRIESEQDVGTKVMITMPKVEEEIYETKQGR